MSESKPFTVEEARRDEQVAKIAFNRVAIGLQYLVTAVGYPSVEREVLDGVKSLETRLDNQPVEPIIAEFVTNRYRDVWAVEVGVISTDSFTYQPLTVIVDLAHLSRHNPRIAPSVDDLLQAVRKKLDTPQGHYCLFKWTRVDNTYSAGGPLQCYQFEVEWWMASTVTFYARNRQEAYNMARRAQLRANGEFMPDSYQVIEESCVVLAAPVKSSC